MDQGTCFLIVYLPAAKTKNIYSLYLNTNFSHVKNFFKNILLKTAWLCDVWLQNYGPLCIYKRQIASHSA